MAYCFMRMEKIKSLASLSRKQAHNLREGFVPNADTSRSFMNEELIPSDGKSFTEAYKQKIKESDYYKKHKVRKDAVRGIEVMLSYSNQKGEDMSKMNLDEWKKANVEWLQETFGKENVVSATLHMDEATPHIHAIIIPMVNERLNASHYMKGMKDGEKIMTHWQTDYAKKMEKFGLERGLNKSTARHKDIRKFYAEVNNVLKKELPPIKKGESLEEYRKRANEVYQEANIQHYKEKQILDRKIVERNTIDLQEQIDFRREKSVFEKEKDDFIREYGATPSETKIVLDKMNVMKKALENYEDTEYVDAVVSGLHEIERYYREKYMNEKKKNKDKKEHLEKSEESH